MLKNLWNKDIIDILTKCSWENIFNSVSDASKSSLYRVAKVELIVFLQKKTTTKAETGSTSILMKKSNHLPFG